MGQQSSTPKINKNDVAIFKLKLQRDTLIKYNTNLGLLINNDITRAKECLGKKKREQALVCMRSKKRHQELLSKTLAQIDTLEELISTIQFKLVEKDFLASLQQGNQILKTLNKECSAEKVDSIMNDARDQVEIQNEVNDAISLGNMAGVADEDIEQDLRKLEQEVLGDTVEEKLDKMPNADDIPIFPNVKADEELKEDNEQKEKHAKEAQQPLAA